MFVDKMTLGDEFSSCKRSSSQMPLRIVEGAQYMNDAVGSVFGKYKQARSYQKSTEFRGGIWDCNPMPERVTSEPICMDTSNATNKTYSLEEILGCDDEEMKDDIDFVNNPNKPVSATFSIPAACSEAYINKRWRSEELDKVSLLSNALKKTKKSVSFSDTVVNLEDFPKRSSKESSISERTKLKETYSIENNQFQVAKSVNDLPVEMETDKYEKETGSVKVQNLMKLMPQQFENKLPDQQKKIKGTTPKKSLPNKKNGSLKVDYDNRTSKATLKNEEVINRNHLENTIPELFEFIDSKNKSSQILGKKKLKDELMHDANKLKNREEEKSTPQSSMKNSTKGSISPYTTMDLSKNEMKSNNFKEEKENELDLENVLLKIFNDADLAESVKNQVVELAKQKNKMCVDVGTERNEVKQKLVSNLECGKPIKEQSFVHKSEDQSQYESKSSAALKEVCVTYSEKQSCTQLNLKHNEKCSIIDTINEVPLKTDNISGKVSPNLQHGVKNFNSSISSSRSDDCSNWRSQCVDVRKEVTVPEKPPSLNWRNECSNSISRNYQTSSVKYHSSKRNAVNTVEYEYEEESMVVIPLNLSNETPDPLSRFKNINTDPESIWDVPQENKMIATKYNHSRLQKGSKSDDIDAQSFRKDRSTSVPRFFDSPAKNARPNGEISEDKHSSPKKDAEPLVKLNENYRSRSQTRQNVSRRANTASTYWRSPLSGASLEDVFFVIKIMSQQDDTVEKLKILKEDFLEMKKENNKLSEVVPYPGYHPRTVGYSACAVTMFIRCVFSLSYKIPNWLTALEAFALARKFGVSDLMQECEACLTNYKIPSDKIFEVAMCAKQLKALDALKSSKYFQAIQNIKCSSTQNGYPYQSCVVSSSVLVPQSELTIPLLVEVNRGLESCNESDVKNSLYFKSLSFLTIRGIQLKFLTEDITSSTELHIVCEVFQSKKKLFYDEFDVKAKSSLKISFTEEIVLKMFEEVEINVVVEDFLLKMCPILHLTDEFLSHGRFHVKFGTSKTIEKNKCFCIEKLFYTSQA